MIGRFFINSVNTQRLVYSTDTKTEVWDANLTGVMCHIQTWGGVDVGYEGAKFPSHQMWCELGIDIIEGDRIIDGTKTYEVLKVENLDMGKNPHMQLALSVIQ